MPEEARIRAGRGGSEREEKSRAEQGFEAVREVAARGIQSRIGRCDWLGR
jgi:hypothetical protein